MWGYPSDSSVRDIITARRMIGACLFGRRIRILVGFAQTVTTQQEDLGVLDQAVGNGGGDGRIKEDVAPVGKRGVGGDHGRAFVAMARRDYLVKEIGGLLIEGQIAQFVANEQ